MYIYLYKFKEDKLNICIIVLYVKDCFIMIGL